MKIKLPVNLGRLTAVLICVPFLLLMCSMLKNNKNNKIVAYCLFVFAIIFLIYESLWLMGVFYV